MLKGAYENTKNKILLLCEEIQWPLNFFTQKTNYFFEFLISDFDI
jgi:hypothetical protein